MQTETRTLYRSRSGWIFGVCQGLADYSGIHVFWIRLIVVIGAIFTSVVPVLLVYLVAAIFMRPAPVMPAIEFDDWEFYTAYASNRRAALAGLKRRLDHIEHRTRRIEALVTDREYDWDRRLHSGV